MTEQLAALVSLKQGEAEYDCLLNVDHPQNSPSALRQAQPYAQLSPMSFPESNKFSHAKHPKYFKMDNPPQIPAQDPEAREQRKQSELTDLNEQTQRQRPSSMASGSSVAEFGNSVSSLAQESAGVVKETVVEGVPKALHAVQEGISAIAGGAKEVEETVSDSEF